MGNPWPDGESSLSDGGPGSQLTPMGEVDSMGTFALGLGPRRVKIALASIFGVLVLLALIAAVA